MFPLNSNDQYIDSNGKRTNLGSVLNPGTELPEHSEADAGKVLTVGEDGTLEWDENGGAGVDIIPVETWEAMSMAEKLECGICIIQTSESGFNLGNYVNAAEYGDYLANEIETLIMSANSQTMPSGVSFVASASSVYQSNEPYKAFNQASTWGMNDCWHPTAGVPAWIAINFNEDVKVKSFRLRNRTGYIEKPSAFKLQGSDDGNDWTDIQSYEWSETGSGLSIDCTVTNPAFYSCYRIYITEVNSNYGVIAQWKFTDVEVDA